MIALINPTLLRYQVQYKIYTFTTKYIYVCVCMCVCVHIYIYIYTHMHTHMSDEEDTLTSKLTVAYKWDVFFSPSLETYIATRLRLRQRCFLLFHFCSCLNIIPFRLGSSAICECVCQRRNTYRSLHVKDYNELK